MEYMYTGWAIVVVVALTAPIVLMRLLKKTPEPTMSESIRDVLR